MGSREEKEIRQGREGARLNETSAKRPGKSCGGHRMEAVFLEGSSRGQGFHVSIWLYPWLRCHQVSVP